MSLPLKHRAYGVVVESRFPLVGIAATSAPAHLRVRLGHVGVGLPLTVQHVAVADVSAGEDAGQVVLGRSGSHPAAVVPGVVEIRVRGGRVVSITPLVELSAERLTHLAIDLGVPMALGLGDRAVLHAASVAIGAQAMLFLGPTRSGKSTLAMAVCRAGARLVADDCTVLTTDGTVAVAHPSYPFVRLWPASLRMLAVDAEAGLPAWPGTIKRRLSTQDLGIEAAAGPTAVASVVVVDGYATGRPGLQRLSPQDTTMELLGAAVRLVVDDPTRAAAELLRAAAVAEQVRGWRLHVPDDPSCLAAAAELARSTIAASRPLSVDAD